MKIFSRQAWATEKAVAQEKGTGRSEGRWIWQDDELAGKATKDGAEAPGKGLTTS